LDFAVDHQPHRLGHFSLRSLSLWRKAQEHVQLTALGIDQPKPLRLGYGCDRWHQHGSGIVTLLYGWVAAAVRIDLALPQQVRILASASGARFNYAPTPLVNAIKQPER
jgi:hypothetical protein